MDFRIEHTFPADPDAVAKVMLDEKYQASLDGIGPLSERKVLEQENLADGVVRRRVRCVLDIDISGPAKKFIGDSDPAWIEHATWAPDEHAWGWTIEPLAADELLKASGRIDLAPGGEGTVRTVLGTVKVSIPIVGGKVEGWIVDGLERAYREEASHLRRWLSG
ncbi:MAG: DUF2505 domain-containing protein [Actinomycetota bacterium]